MVAVSAGTDRIQVDEEQSSSGWMTFAGVIIMIAAVLNIIGGISAIGDSKFWIADTKFVISDLHGYGWSLLIIGVIELFVAFGIWSGAQWARWTGVFIVSLNLISHMLFLNANATWSFLAALLDILVIYGLAAHGGRGQARVD